RGVARRFDRREILRRMGADLGVLNGRNSLLGIMLSETLLADGWAKDVVEENHFYDRKKHKWKSDKDVDEGFAPGDELYYRSDVRGVPLYVNETIMRLNLGKVDYTFFLLDKLGHSGSEFNMVQGLVQTRRKEYVTADVTAGGHMQLTGFSINPPKPRVYIPTGWLSDYDSQGKGNKRRVATGGQAVILFSDRKLVVPVSNLNEATDTFNAFLLDRGLTGEEKKKLAKKTR
ncbi:MAG TPA: hypothetical protein VJ227_02240, partial [Patescibacteria group bacterium]|nr:hypothetical protein [Patescibacteria group bacterium]